MEILTAIWVLSQVYLTYWLIGFLVALTVLCFWSGWHGFTVDKEEFIAAAIWPATLVNLIGVVARKFWNMFQ